MGRWQVYLDVNNDGKYDSGAKAATTDVNGQWTFADLTAGTYHVRVTQVSGTKATTAAGVTVAPAAGQVVTGTLSGGQRIA